MKDGHFMNKLIIDNMLKIGAGILIGVVLTALLIGQQTPIYGDDYHIIVGNNVEIISSVILDYQDYFNAEILNDFPIKKVDLLIVFAHGSTDNSSISLQLKDGVATFTDINANRVIWISCSVGIIDNIDQDTKHYSYSVSNELDVYNFEFKIKDQIFTEVQVTGWATYFLNLIKNGIDWDEAEIQARNMTNEYFKTIKGVA